MPVVYLDEKTISAMKISDSRLHSRTFLALKKDILDNGMHNPLEVSDSARFICITGNQSIHILRELGISKVPAVIQGSCGPKAALLSSGQYRSTPPFPKDARRISGKERARKKIKKKK